MKELSKKIKDLVFSYAKQSEINELIEYNRNQFQSYQWYVKNSLPLEDEAHLVVWQEYCREAKQIGVEAALKKRLVQLNFKIAKNISNMQLYRDVTKKGKAVEKQLQKSSLQLQSEELELFIWQTMAGKIPVIVANRRSDFVALIRALTKKNEPEPIPDSMGACIIGGYNNWDRIHRYRQSWSDRVKPHNSEADWQQEFKQLIAQKQLYQDRFIILSRGSYSNVNPADLGIEADRWDELSLTIRLEHECTHYLTRRLLGSMRNNLLDEAIADYQGIVAANGSYRADWFLHFMGLGGDEYRAGGRLENYRGTPQLSVGAFAILQDLVRKIALNLEAFDRQYYAGCDRSELDKLAVFFTLTSSTLIDLAAADGVEILLAQTNKTKDRLKNRVNIVSPDPSIAHIAQINQVL